MDAVARAVQSGKCGSTSKEKQTQKHESKQLIDELSKMHPMIIATAYLHAINYTLYGADVTEKWLTATQNASALEKAYRKGYHDAMEKLKVKLAQAEMRMPFREGGAK